MNYLQFYKSKLKKFAYGGPMASLETNKLSFNEWIQDPIKIRSESILNNYQQESYNNPAMPLLPSVGLNELQQIIYNSLSQDAREDFNRMMKDPTTSHLGADQILQGLVNDIELDANQYLINLADVAIAHAKRNGMSEEDIKILSEDPEKLNAYIQENNITDSTGRTEAEAVSDAAAVVNAKNKAGISGVEKETPSFNIGPQGQKGLAIGTAAMLALDKATMGDKNFGAQSEAIDSAVHGASAALMNSGNPYLMAGGAAIEAANFLTKAGGQTVQGYDVDINSSGYGQLAHKSSSSSRDFGAMIGLGGLNAGAVNRRLAQRNQEVLMALKASNISDNILFEQEARANAVDDTLQRNLIALQGGIDTSLLAAKNGAKLERKEVQTVVIDLYQEEVISAKNGAKLENIETSEDFNVIPDGALHRNKNYLGLDTTLKGIPVITTENELEEGTLEEIKLRGGEITQHAEIESSEVIFSKELTDYVEENRKKWHDNPKDLELLLEVGKRITKELLTNTEDNTDLISKMEELV